MITLHMILQIPSPIDSPHRTFHRSIYHLTSREYKRKLLRITAETSRRIREKVELLYFRIVFPVQKDGELLTIYDSRDTSRLLVSPSGKRSSKKFRLWSGWWMSPIKWMKKRRFID